MTIPEWLALLGLLTTWGLSAGGFIMWLTRLGSQITDHEKTIVKLEAQIQVQATSAVQIGKLETQIENLTAQMTNMTSQMRDNTMLLMQLLPKQRQPRAE